MSTNKNNKCFFVNSDWQILWKLGVSLKLNLADKETETEREAERKRETEGIFLIDKD